MSTRTLDIIEGESITWDGTVLRFWGRGRIDDDGSGSPHGDKFHQKDTSLHYKGKPLNADVDQYAVLPKELVDEVLPIVLGCQGFATYRGVRYPTVVGDLGPNNREGEISIALSDKMRINDDPNFGGDDSADILFEFYPGQQAIVDGKVYDLQPHR